MLACLTLHWNRGDSGTAAPLPSPLTWDNPDQPTAVSTVRQPPFSVQYVACTRPAHAKLTVQGCSRFSALMFTLVLSCMLKACTSDSPLATCKLPTANCQLRPAAEFRYYRRADPDQSGSPFLFLFAALYPWPVALTLPSYFDCDARINSFPYPHRPKRYPFSSPPYFLPFPCPRTCASPSPLHIVILIFFLASLAFRLHFVPNPINTGS